MAKRRKNISKAEIEALRAAGWRIQRKERLIFTGAFQDEYPPEVKRLCQKYGYGVQLEIGTDV